MAPCHQGPPSPEKSSAGLSSFSLRVFSKWDRSRLVGSLASSTSSGGKRQGDLLLPEGGTHTGAHTSYCQREGTGEHAHPQPTDPPGASAAAVAFGTPQGFSFAKAPGDLVEAARAAAARGSIVGNCLALRRGRRGRHAVSPRGMRRTCLEGAPGLGVQHEHARHLLPDGAPAGPRASPAAAAPPG